MESCVWQPNQGPDILLCVPNRTDRLRRIGLSVVVRGDFKDAGGFWRPYGVLLPCHGLRVLSRLSLARLAR
jgi:hypothetical protein